VGQGSWLTSINGKATKEYALWKGVLTRGYDSKFKEQHPAYKYTTVNKRWHNFQNFCNDILLLDGYIKWKTLNGYELDKDIKVKGNRSYSKETCVFVTHKENNARGNKRQNITGLTYIATRLSDGYREEFLNQSVFSDKYNLTIQNVNHCIMGDRQTHKGWRFEIKKEIK
jgi:hypothetical protein